MVQMMPRILDFGFIPYSDPVRVPRPGGVRSSVEINRWHSERDQGG